MATQQHARQSNFTLLGFIQVTRFWNLSIIILAQYFTAIFLIHPGQPLLRYLLNNELFLLSLSSVLIAAAGYIINDYYDIKIDLINKPGRVIVGKTLKRRVAMAAHIMLSFTGIILGLLLSWKIALVNLLSASLLWWYSNQLKRMPFVGNLAVAVLTGLAIYIVEVLFKSGNIIVLAYALFAFAFTLIREIIKDMEDLKGDATFGCKTLPVIYGLRATKKVIYAIAVLFLAGFSVLAYYIMGMKMLVFSFLLLIPLSFLTFKLSKADTIRDFHQLSNYCKIIMLLGILSMIFFK